MTVSTIKMASWQYLMLGEDPPGIRLELVDGDVVVSPSPTPKHGRTVGRLYRQLDEFVRANDLGEVLMDFDTTLDVHNVRRPDLLYYTKERQHFITDERTTAVPDLAVEVVSSGSIETDREVKPEQYAAANIPFYWIIDPLQKSFHAYELVNRGYELSAEAPEDSRVNARPFEGLSLDLAILWQ